jgi:uncharacterized repeat protein (TIGR01451 family)
LEKEMKNVTRIVIAAALASSVMTPMTITAQEAASPAADLTGFWLTTPYPELAIEPGETESITLTLRNEKLPPQRAAIEVSGVPEGWEWALKGGGKPVTATIVSPDSSERLTLELTPPADALSDQDHAIEVRARSASETITLPLTVRLAAGEVEEGGLELEPELPALRGTARSTFSFKVKVTNKGAEEGFFNLAADVPQGFQTRFKKGFGSDEITGLPIGAGATETATVEVVPSRATPAGQYPVGFRVSGNGLSGTTDLTVDVTGEPQVRIVGPQERLSGEVEAGKETNFTFTLVNTGTAPATDIELSATPPSGWNVDFEPKQVAEIAPNATSEVAVKITPSERAIAGDYMVTVRAAGGPVSGDVQFRTTVRTSTLWGVAGLGVIAAAVLVLGGAVMRYGRR